MQAIHLGFSLKIKLRSTSFIRLNTAYELFFGFIRPEFQVHDGWSSLCRMWLHLALGFGFRISFLASSHSIRWPCTLDMIRPFQQFVGKAYSMSMSLLPTSETRLNPHLQPKIRTELIALAEPGQGAIHPTTLCPSTPKPHMILIVLILLLL